MAEELVLLSEVPVTPDLLADVARDVMGGGTGVQYRNGEIVQFIDPEGNAVLTVFDSIPVHVPTEAAAQLMDPPASFGLWTEMTIPFASSPFSRPLAQAIAERIGGSVRTKK